MLKRILLIVFLSSLFFSCQWFQSEKVLIDFNEVDEYPFYPGCDSLVLSTYKKNCFEEAVVSHLSSYLEKQEFKTAMDINDAIIVHLEIDKNGQASLHEIETSSVILEHLPQLDSLLRVAINNLPKMQAAQKKGLSVNSRYMIPIYILEE